MTYATQPVLAFRADLSDDENRDLFDTVAAPVTCAAAEPPTARELTYRDVNGLRRAIHRASSGSLDAFRVMAWVLAPGQEAAAEVVKAGRDF